MTVYQQEEQIPSSILDLLYCEEDNFEDEEETEEKQSTVNEIGLNEPTLLNPILELEQDCIFDDEELISLLTKEQKQVNPKQRSDCEVSGRKEVVEWMLMVNNYFGFSGLTSVLSVNYLDRFLTSFKLCDDKPWSLQLAAVSCLSLAAKVEETFVPLLIDLQIEGTKLMFEAKNIQKMELLVLSTLEWKMHPVTSLSFLHHLIRRLGLNHHLHWEFMIKCERLLLSLLPDGRFVGCIPSVLASATMMHVIDQIDPYGALYYHSQLMSLLKITKEKVKDCYQLIKELFSTSTMSTKIECNGHRNGDGSAKRKWEQMMMMINENTSSNTKSCRPSSGSSSPSGVIDASYNYTCDSSNDSWATSTTITTATTTSHATSNHNNNNYHNNGVAVSSFSSSPSLSRKKGRMMCEHQLPRVFFVDFIGTP